MILLTQNTFSHHLYFTLDAVSLKKTFGTHSFKYGCCYECSQGITNSFENFLGIIMELFAIQMTFYLLILLFIQEWTPW